MESNGGRRPTDDELAQMKHAIIKEITNRPPTIGVIGVSGTGKSSTINALFKTDLPISHVTACTKEFRTVPLETMITKGEATGERVSLHVVDAPGLGEDLARDPDYLDMYHEHLPKCDVILWVITARNRAVALDQIYLEEFHQYHDRIMFAINQVDLVEPMDWNEKLRLPSKEQEENIMTIREDRKSKLQSIVGREITIVPYSAQRRYHLQELFTTLVKASPKDRAWIFSAIKGFQPDDWMPADVREEVRKSEVDPISWTGGRLN